MDHNSNNVDDLFALENGLLAAKLLGLNEIIVEGASYLVYQL